jgi:hypothetical protein
VLEVESMVEYSIERVQFKSYLMGCSVSSSAWACEQLSIQSIM